MEHDACWLIEPQPLGLRSYFLQPDEQQNLYSGGTGSIYSNRRGETSWIVNQTKRKFDEGEKRRKVKWNIMKMWGLDQANEERTFIPDAARQTRWADMQGRQAGRQLYLEQSRLSHLKAKQKWCFPQKLMCVEEIARLCLCGKQVVGGVEGGEDVTPLVPPWETAPSQKVCVQYYDGWWLTWEWLDWKWFPYGRCILNPLSARGRAHRIFMLRAGLSLFQARGQCLLNTLIMLLHKCELENSILVQWE